MPNVPDLELRAGDLAPGDRGVGERDWSDLRVHRVGGVGDPDFGLAYERLWSEFGALGEMERRRVIEERLAWDPARPRGGTALAYELLVLRRAGRLAALRDHSALVRPDAAPDRYRLYLFALAAALLERAGVARVDTQRISTFADPRCFSHRRAASAGGGT